MRDWDYSIHALTLRNYRKFKEFHMSFNDYLTIITGNNATGKTSILCALAVAAGTLLTKMEDAKAPAISQTDVRHESFHQGSSLIRQAQYPVFVAAQGSLNNHPFSWQRGLSSRKGRTTYKEALSLIEAGDELQTRVSKGSSVTLPVIAFYNANRFASKNANAPILQKTESSFLPSRTRGYLGCLDAWIDETQTLTWMRNMTFWELQNSQKSPELCCVHKAIAACFTGAIDAQEVQVRFDLELQDIVLIYVDQHNVTHQDPVAMMSDGYRSALLMFADIARRMAQLNPHLLEDALYSPGIILIDEIDLHLHPRWQARIIKDLRTVFPNVQFIVTTHSPSVIASACQAEIRMLGETTALIPDFDVYGHDTNFIIEDVLGANTRPREVQDMFDAYYRLFDTMQFKEAEKKLDEIESLIGPDDSDLAAERTALALETD